ncbi:MAG: DUF3147 family protein [Candidatus Poseidoniaceae archaeon]|jgi:F0F1-type ATP synthase assembly protein I|nr:DUF3147 family protein [Candidatus Poseidoniaceae archaeon]
MTWLSWLAKGLFSGAIIVVASEVAKKSTIYGALIISIPFMSIMSLILLYNDTKDPSRVADYAEGILWLVLPSMLLFILLPYLLRRDWSFEAALTLGIGVTVMAYFLGIYFSKIYTSASV